MNDSKRHKHNIKIFIQFFYFILNKQFVYFFIYTVYTFINKVYILILINTSMLTYNFLSEISKTRRFKCITIKAHMM